MSDQIAHIIYDRMDGEIIGVHRVFVDIEDAIWYVMSEMSASREQAMDWIDTAILDTGD